MLAPWKKSCDVPRQHIKKQRCYFADKGPSSQSCGFSSSPVWLWELYHKEGWALKNWCFWTVVLKKTLESPLECKGIKPVNPKGINPEYSLEGLMLRQKLQHFGHLMPRADSLWKPLRLGRIEGKRRSGSQRIRWLVSLNNGYEFEQIPGDSEGQGSLACCPSWGHKESDMTEWLNNCNKVYRGSFWLLKITYQ